MSQTASSLVSDLRKKSRKVKSDLQREKLQVLEQAIEFQRRQAEDDLHRRVVLAAESLDATVDKAAAHGKSEETIVRLPVKFYDVRQAVLDELTRTFDLSRAGHSDPYPNLRVKGPYAFRDVDNWVQEAQLSCQPHRTSPSPWLDELALWMQRYQSAGALKRLLIGEPKLPAELKELFARCKAKGLKPSFEFFQHREDQGVELKVHWK